MDQHSQFLQAQALNACYVALGSAQINSYGPNPWEESGVIIESENLLEYITYRYEKATNLDGTDAEGNDLFRYHVAVSISVYREKIGTRKI